MPERGELEEALLLAAAWLSGLAAGGGPDLTVNAHHKAVHEARELAASRSLEEAADVLICLVGVAVREGWTLGAMAEAVRAKVSVNEGRAWQQQPDGTWQHA